MGRGDTVALMLLNRPEFHFADAAVMHLGATPFSIYNTYTEEQITHLVRDSASRIVITEQSHADKILAVRDAVEGVEEVVLVDGEPPAGTISLDRSPRAATMASTSRPLGGRYSRRTC